MKDFILLWALLSWPVDARPFEQKAAEAPVFYAFMTIMTAAAVIGVLLFHPYFGMSLLPLILLGVAVSYVSERGSDWIGWLHRKLRGVFEGGGKETPPEQRRCGS